MTQNSNAVALDADQVTRKLRAFADLAPGWSFGDGVPVSQSAISIATGLLRWASQLTLKADVFPGLDGECMVAFYRGEDAVRIIVYPGQGENFGLRVERGDGPDFTNVIEPVEHASRSEVYKHVVGLPLSSGEGSPKTSGARGRNR